MLVFEGPNKVGKSTAVNAALSFLGGNGFLEKCNFPGDIAAKEYFGRRMDATIETAKEFFPVWDRSWVSNVIYNQLLPDRNEASPLDSAFYGEFHYGMIMQALGTGYILTRHQQLDVDDAVSRDLFEKEVAAYKEYAQIYPHWELLDTSRLTKVALGQKVHSAISKSLTDFSELRQHVPDIIGNVGSKILMVAPAARGKNPRPFHFDSGYNMMQMIGPDVFKTAWTYQGSMNPALLKGFPLAIAFGTKASTWARYYCRIFEVVSMPAPHLMTTEDADFVRRNIESVTGK